jgi:hypothetical protein
MVFRYVPTRRAVSSPVRVPDFMPNPSSLSAKPIRFYPQVQRGVSFPIVDWLGLKTLLVDDGRGIDHVAYLREAALEEEQRPYHERRLLPVPSREGAYHLVVSPTCQVFLSTFNGRLHVNGNPCKVDQGFNEFCPREPGVQIQRYTHAVIEALRALGRKGLVFVNDTLTRIDITQMVDLGSAPVAAATFSNLHLHLRCFGGNGVERDVHTYPNTIYYGKASSRYALKLYRVSSKPRAAVQPEDDRWVRFEVTLRRPELVAMERRGTWTPKDLNRVVLAHLGSLKEIFHQYRPDRMKHPPRDLPQDLWGAWYVWAAGGDVKLVPEFQDRFPALRHQFKEYGIDLRVPPTPRRWRYTQALKLADFVDPSRFDADGRSCPDLLRALRVRV